MRKFIEAARIVGVAAAVFFSASLAAGQELAPRGERGAGDPPAGSIGDELRRRDDNAPISVTGTVKSVRSENITIGDGRTEVVVEFDRARQDAGAYRIQLGHRVTVYGETDKDLFERRTIEASMIYDHESARFLYADEEDEELSFRSVPTERLSSRLLTYGLAGTIAEIRRREFTLRTIGGVLTVDTGGLSAPRRFEPGDRVVVYGTFDDTDAFDAREIRATSIERIRH